MSHEGNPEYLHYYPNAIQDPTMAEDIAYAPKLAEADLQLNQAIVVDGQVNDTGGITGQSVEQVTGVAPASEIIPDFKDALSVDRQGTIITLANAFHEVWLRTRNQRSENGAIWANGERTPRPKPTADQEWSERKGDTMVDIANTGFVRLPEDWKAENDAAAEVIIDLVDSLGGAEKIDLDDAEVYEKCGQAIHSAWLKRNTYAKDGPLDIDFGKLPPDEQAKDLEQLSLALELLKPDSLPQHRDFRTRVLHTVNNWALEKHLPMRDVHGDLISPGSSYYDDQYAALLGGRR